jgi:cell division protein FtsB
MKIKGTAKALENMSSMRFRSKASSVYRRLSRRGYLSHKSEIDLWMQRIAWSAQVVALVVAIFGYFYTVRPVYQKQLLDEQIAEKSVLLRDSTAKLEQLRDEEKKLKNENIRLHDEANNTYSRLRKNLISELGTVSAKCAYLSNVKDANLLDGQKLMGCITNNVTNDVMQHLRSDDSEKVKNLLNMHRDEIVSLPERVEGDRAEALKRAKKELNQLTTKREANVRVFLAKINKLRKPNVGHERTIKRLEDLKELLNAEETNLYLEFVNEDDRLMVENIRARGGLIQAEISVSQSLSEDVRKIMKKITEKLN